MYNITKSIYKAENALTDPVVHTKTNITNVT